MFLLLQQASYESCKPLGAWVQDLIHRVDFFSAWAELVISTATKALKPPPQQPQGTQQQQQQQQTHQQEEEFTVVKAQPLSFWLSAFFFPQGIFSPRQRSVHARSLLWTFPFVNYRELF